MIKFSSIDGGRRMIQSIPALICLALLSSPVAAQQRTELKVADTSSPRDTLKSFIDACNEVNDLINEAGFFDRDRSKHVRLSNRIIACLDMSETPQFAQFQRSSEVAVCLKEILDRVEIPDWEEIPDTQEIQAAGGYEKLSTWRIPGTRITIARADEGPQKHEYLFSPGTVNRAVEYFESIRDQPYRTEGPAVSEGLYDWFMSAPGNPTVAKLVATLPESFRKQRFLGMAAWKWPGVLLATFVASALILISYRLQWTMTPRAREKSIFRYCLTIVFPVFAMLVPSGFRYGIQTYLTVRGDPLLLLSFLSGLAAVLAAFVVVFAVVNRVAESIIASPRIKNQGLNAQLIRIVSQLIGLVASLVLFIVGGQYLGIPVGTLLASAGIFGAAIALSSQDILKSLLGTLTLLGDKPFRVGDRIKFKDYEGWIEDIGLRSTRLRLLEGHLVRLPNDELANNDVENLSKREHIRRNATIHIPLDTPREQVEKAVSVIKEKLENHEGMPPDQPPRVILDEFGSQSFCIRFWYWYSPPDLWRFREFNSRINFEIFREFEEHGIQYSLPFRHTFWKHDAEQGPLDIRVMPESDV